MRIINRIKKSYITQMSEAKDIRLKWLKIEETMDIVATQFKEERELLWTQFIYTSNISKREISLEVGGHGIRFLWWPKEIRVSKLLNDKVYGIIDYVEPYSESIESRIENWLIGAFDPTVVYQ